MSTKIVFDPQDLFWRWDPLAREVSEFFADCNNSEAFGQLIEDGLDVYPLGLDFSRVHADRSPASRQGEFLLGDEFIRKLRQIYYPTRIHEFFWDVDVPIGYRPEPPEISRDLSQRERELLAAFRRDGYVQIEHWDGLDLEQAAREAVAHIEAERDHFSLKNVEALAPLLLKGSLLWKLVLGYLGSDARYNGVESFRLVSNVSRRTYANANWHHDGCGRRLKAFIYLHDVDERTHPTLIAKGTHGTQWFPTTHFFAGREGHNKLNGTLVRAIYGDAIVKVFGPAGGGFVFDTNLLHAVDVEGEHKQRDVIVLDFASTEHMDRIPRSSRSPEDKCISYFPPYACPKPQRGGKKFDVRLEGETLLQN